MATPKPIDDTQLKTIVEAELRNSLGYLSGTLSEDRRRAEYYYRAEPKGELAGPGIPGRSTVVSTDVLEVVEGVMPRLIKFFCASDNAVEFAATVPGEEDQARLATEYINYLFFRRNPGYVALYTAFKDAVLQRNGIIKVYWDKSAVEEREEYKALTDMQLTLLVQDPAVTIVEHTDYPDPNAPPAGMPGQAMPGMPPQPMLHDVAVTRVMSRGRVRLEPVPPEEFLMSKRGKSIEDTPFCAHRFQRTISQLRSAGYQNVDDLSSDDWGAVNSERIERLTFDDDSPLLGMQQGNGDPSSRIVWVEECYLQVDVDGDGIAEWRKIVRVGATLLGDPETGETSVECDGPPFAEFRPIIMPHRYTGLSLADLAMQSQRERTAIKRAILDNLSLQVNGRTWAVEGQVNIDDLLTNRPGGIVRITAPGAVGPLQQGMSDANGAYQMLEYSLVERENRTGFTRYSQGQSADSLNKTATGMNIITNRSDERIELIARTFAETGMKQLFLRMLKLVSQHQDQPENLPLAGGFTQVNPREWRNQFDFVVNVGLGTGNKDQQVQHLSMLIQQMMQVVPMGIAQPVNLYQALRKLSDALGYGKSADQLLTDPTKLPPPQPPPPDPRIALEQAKLQDEQQYRVAQMQMDQQAQAAKMQQAQAELQQKQALEVQKYQLDLEFEREKLAREQAAELELARLKYQAEADMKAMELNAQRYATESAAMEHAGESVAVRRDQVALAQSLQALMGGIQALLRASNAPRRVVRDASGMIVGAEPVLDEEAIEGEAV